VINDERWGIFRYEESFSQTKGSIFDNTCGYFCGLPVMTFSSQF